MAAIDIGRSRARQRERRRQRIELIHEMSHKKISGAEIARRLGVSRNYRLPGSASGAAADNTGAARSCRTTAC